MAASTGPASTARPGRAARLNRAGATVAHADWHDARYLAPWINDIAPGSAQDFMYFVGAVEILAGIAVAIKPRYGAYVVAAWLAGIVINLLTHSGYYDIALRDFGLMLAALALARVASAYDTPLRAPRS